MAWPAEAQVQKRPSCLCVQKPLGSQSTKLIWREGEGASGTQCPQHCIPNCEDEAPATAHRSLPTAFHAMSPGLTHAQTLNTSPTDLPSQQTAWILSRLTINWPWALRQAPIPLWTVHASLFGKLHAMVFKIPALLMPHCPLTPPQPQFLEPSWLSTDAWFHEYSSGARPGTPLANQVQGQGQQ